MKIHVPVRFSRGWWLSILATTILTGAVALVVLRYFPDLTWEAVVIYCFLIMFVGDLIVALSMEAVAPSRVRIGPGERQFEDDHVSEQAVVSRDFDELGFGQVKIRGELWQARLVHGDSTRVRIGMPVRVLDRDGLVLVVSEEPS